MMHAADFSDAVAHLRSSGLPPTREHIVVTKLMLDAAGPVDLDELHDRVLDEKLGLSRETLSVTLARLEGVGVPKKRRSARRMGATPMLDAQHVAAYLKAMSHPVRLMVLCLVRSQARSVGELEKQIGIHQSALSQHLSKLRHAGLVKTKRVNQNIYYSLASPALLPLLDAFCAFECETKG